jgi:pimeloyl-ACP methyl ester carboxylesterase
MTSIMSSTGNPTLPAAAPDVMAMMVSPAPNPFEDEAGFLQHSLAFSRRIASPGFPFDGEVHSALLLEEARRACNSTGFARQIAAIAVAGDRRSRLASITAPTLVIHGADDPLLPPACGRDTASSIPHADFMLIEGMGHDLPPELYQVVGDGIERIARRA